jgi:hypothetical protein
VRSTKHFEARGFLERKLIAFLLLWKIFPKIHRPKKELNPN